MASIPQSQAYTDAKTESDAEIAAANAQFIADADVQILSAIAQGQFFIVASAYDKIDPKTISDYYANLGYHVSFPDFVQNDLSHQPAQLFGAFWTAFWAQLGFVPASSKRPIRILIAWNP